MIKKVIAWIVFSSKDPNKLALTLKAGIPFLIFLGLGDYVSIENANIAVDQGVNLLIAGVQFATGAVTFFAFCRKIYIPIKIKLGY